MSEDARMPIEHWATERGHVDPSGPLHSAKGPLYQLSDFKGWVYQCVRSHCGSIGHEMTLDEYDATVEYVLHGVTAR